MDKKIGKNIFFNFVKTLMNILFPFITFPYVSRVLGVDGIGKVQYCNSIISYFTLIATLGITIYAVREGSKYKNDREKLTRFSKEILCINTISMFIAYLLFIFYFFCVFSESYQILMIVCSFSILFSAYSVEWLYQIKEDYYYISLRSFIIQIISLFFLFMFVKDKNDYIIYAFVSILGSSGSFAFNLIHSKKYIDFLKKEKLNLKKHIKPILTIFGISISSSIYMNLDIAMLGIIHSTTAVGLYSAAVKLSHVIKQLVASFSNVLFPRLAHYKGNDQLGKYNELLKNGLRLTILLIIPASIGMCVLSKELLLLLSGSDYISASIASKILSINMIFSVIDGALYYQIILPYGEEKKAVFITSLGAIVNFILNMIIIPLYSYNGAAFTTFIAELVVFIGLLYFSKNIIEIRVILKYILNYVILSIPIVIIYMILRLIITSGILLIISTILFSVLTYLFLLVLCKDYFIINFHLFIRKIFTNSNIKNK